MYIFGIYFSMNFVELILGQRKKFVFRCGKKNKTGGYYIAKLGYKTLQGNAHQDVKWWWDKIQKNKSHVKTKLFMWLTLTNKVLTWEMLQKRNTEGFIICLLYKQGDETTTYLFIGCIISQHIWSDMGHWMGYNNI